jgi:hypothetical protein
MRNVDPDRNRAGTRSLIAIGLFTLTVLLSAVRFYLLRHYLDFTDEADHTTIGWLLTRGETLYGSVFSHHMPLPYVAAQLVASLSPTDHPAHFRVVPWLGYLAVAAAIVGSPLVRRNPGAGLLAGSAFLVLASISLPPFLGHMLLADVLGGCGLSVSVALVVLPALTGFDLMARDAAIGGIGLGLALAASPPVILPAAAALAGVGCLGAVAPRQTPSAIRLAGFFLLGLAISLSVIGIWLVLFGRPAGFVEEVLDFNRRYYGPIALAPYGPTADGVLRGQAREWQDLIQGAVPLTILQREMVLAFLSLVFAATAAGAFLAGRKGAGTRHGATTRRLVAVASLLVMFFFSAPRGFDFRGLPFFITALAAGWWRALRSFPPRPRSCGPYSCWPFPPRSSHSRCRMRPFGRTSPLR